MQNQWGHAGQLNNPKKVSGLMKIQKSIQLLLLIVAIGLFFSEAVGQVVETSSGKVEFIGLKKWTPKAIQEKLGYSSSDQLHYCAAELKKIGFPESSVMAYREDGKRYTVITVVEPQRVGQIQYRPKPLSSLRTPDEWRDLIQLVEEKKHLNGLLNYGSTLKQGVSTINPEIPAEPWCKLLQQRRSNKDYLVCIGTES